MREGEEGAKSLKKKKGGQCFFAESSRVAGLLGPTPSTEPEQDSAKMRSRESGRSRSLPHAPEPGGASGGRLAGSPDTQPRVRGDEIVDSGWVEPAAGKWPWGEGGWPRIHEPPPSTHHNPRHSFNPHRGEILERAGRARRVAEGKGQVNASE